MRWIIGLVVVSGLSVGGVGGCGATGGSGDRGGLPMTLVRHQTEGGLGAVQGVAVHGGFIYVYGDGEVGIVREYRLVAEPFARLVATGREIRLTRGGEDLISHPTGLTFHPEYGCFLGDTVRGVGRIYRIDFERALAEGNLDGAVLNVTVDDAAVNGTRPEFVLLNGRWVIATSDYGAGPNFVRYYDPAKLMTAKATSEAGVEIRRVPCGAFVQNLHFIRETGELVLIQNQIAGLRWRLTVVGDLGAADYRNVKSIDFDRPTNELEGVTVVGRDVAVYVSAMREENVTIAIRSR